ncbi:MAG: hypothetical protein Q9M16_07420, partial [Mariprofundus sp.]|nr:hypothetical protein [Mariprofundus sp.]
MNSNQLPVSGGIAIFFAVIIGYFIIDPSALDGFRPGGISSQIEQVHGIEDVQARLWQDPFAAAAAHRREKHRKTSPQQLQLAGKVDIPPRNKEKSTSVNITVRPIKMTAAIISKHSFQSLLEQISIQSKESKQKVDILAVMVSASPYTENRETRLRKRYAVIAGLAASGYQPQESAHIGYVDDLKDSDCRKNHIGEKKLPMLMPFEWFKNNDNKYTLLLWLDEDAFSYSPLCKLNFLFKAEDDTSQSPTVFQSSKLGRVSIIGPHNSGTLKAMISELDKPKNKLPSLKNVFFFSATATAAMEKLINISPKSIDKPQQNTESYDRKNREYPEYPITRKFLSKQIIFFRTIANDKKLTDQLVIEIKKRLFDWNPWPEDNNKENNFQIALVSEWDTLYGRSLPEAFIASASDAFMATDKATWAQEHIYRFSYLRGIDGKVSNARQTGEGKLSNTKEGDTKRAHMERPEGTSQKDYLRRLASDMARTHQRLKNKGTKGIRAIGVLGSDVYDKLLILRALRKQFPKAIFFTTDLDAALLHPDQFQWARNMLVASSFDLKIASYSDIKQMKEAIEKGAVQTSYFQMLLDVTKRTIPQNRDAYQTSVFLSTIWAANPILSKSLATKMTDAIDKTNEGGGSLQYIRRRKDSDSFQFITAIDNAAIMAIQETFDQVFGSYIDPRVYEIGRFGATDLTAFDYDKDDETLQLNPFYPLPMKPISIRAMIMITSSTVMLSLLSFLFWRRWITVADINTNNKFRDSMKREDIKAIQAAVLAVIILGGCYIFQCSEKTLMRWVFFNYFLI